jgi:hypothetical protein
MRRASHVDGLTPHSATNMHTHKPASKPTQRWVKSGKMHTGTCSGPVRMEHQQCNRQSAMCNRQRVACRVHVASSRQRRRAHVPGANDALAASSAPTISSPCRAPFAQTWTVVDCTSQPKTTPSTASASTTTTTTTTRHCRSTFLALVHPKPSTLHLRLRLRLHLPPPPRTPPHAPS